MNQILELIEQEIETNKIYRNLYKKELKKDYHKFPIYNWHCGRIQALKDLKQKIKLLIKES